MNAYLKLDHIDKAFSRGSTESQVLKDINLVIDKGEAVSIIGHSGCGKSTLLNLLVEREAADVVEDARRERLVLADSLGTGEQLGGQKAVDA